MAFEKYEDNPNMIVASVARQMEALYAEFQASQIGEKEFLLYGDRILNSEKFARRIDDRTFMAEIRNKFAEMKELSRSLL